jgi:hypothetical protein
MNTWIKNFHDSNFQISNCIMSPLSSTSVSSNINLTRNTQLVQRYCLIISFGKIN